jgi:hypothetical protein
LRGGVEWEYQSGLYELATLTQAAKLYRVFADITLASGLLREWVDGENEKGRPTVRDDDETKNIARALSCVGEPKLRELGIEIEEGHSGNTWGASVRLAWLLYAQPGMVPKEHAAICPLLGCQAARCWAASAEAEADGS